MITDVEITVNGKNADGVLTVEHASLTRAEWLALLDVVHTRHDELVVVNKLSVERAMREALQLHEVLCKIDVGG